MYLPFDNHWNDYLPKLDAVLAHINAVCDKYVGCNVMILGDFNFQCTHNCKGYKSFESFALNFDLLHCDELDNNKVGY